MTHSKHNKAGSIVTTKSKKIVKKTQEYRLTVYKSVYIAERDRLPVSEIVELIGRF